MTTGWAKAVYSGGPITGAATLHHADNTITKPVIGFPAGLLAAKVALPVGSDGPQSGYVGISVANPNEEDIYIRIIAYDVDGTVLDSVSPEELNPLPSHSQVARYLHEYLLAQQLLKGSVAFVSQGGRKFVVAAALQNGDLYTVIPVVALFP